jgi:2-polyprenyl-6-methoxyphenol hydroxylase-like FAD-dependent oxidoreductase
MAWTQVLIAGAGPTGLVLALWLKRLGVSTRIVDKAPRAGEHSRALAIQARTLEFYDQIGITEPILAEGLKFAAMNLWAQGRRAARIEIGDVGHGLSRYPYVLILPQDRHERILIDQLRRLGQEVERELEVVSVQSGADGVRTLLRRPDGSEEICESDYLAGCDGAHSAVREALGVGFPGGTYAHTFYVADVAASGPVMDQELHIAFDGSEFLGVFPLKPDGAARLIGAVRDDERPPDEELGWNDVSHLIFERMQIAVKQVNWFSTYRVHHRVAGSFREGRVFLLGDAGHIHSPVGGQGMNTGIGDAVNLAWKLAATLQGAANEKILDTYEAERIGFAQRLVATTDQLFTLATSPGEVARRLRTQVAPRLVPTLWRSRTVRRTLFKIVSETAISYRGSPLAKGAAGRAAGGDRLAWSGHDSGPAGGDNFTPLVSLDWQVHVYGEPSVELEETCAARGIPLRSFGWRPDFWRAGLMRDAAYLIRPDGYIALAEPNARTAPLTEYLDDWSIKPRQGSGTAAASEAPLRRTRAARPRSEPSPDVPAQSEQEDESAPGSAAQP